ncbi:bifunctional 5,10-methylene-tetrahydrofolate dehydrogenase/5,10-methylene-tetrahydrofolate cyclohydrolase [Alicyclobacillus contaminans]|uniref:bifunctional 5,10-methylenetetrahydrofolate dehydrogenase/5,10-methenyltetrahydrofolate cyclohydrolase n=1 Tax=Alicyclobacillus contaminans TaxID=392016 RepID=UPI00041179A8|nr:bifunctional 5,10-methylenetetrahydrofolate dehydrogenase/5,10-methenyltetrahydrofolate cyclohydrolase [Alicyclobacillus contaminans]GMA50638.1 bifunctional 5,10-methylene-tetrahydrofolate dehydrogenase/5,10-methylene-tetrahydrofolate cyclohydrolase [Alicyclobacillus contaminans]
MTICLKGRPVTEPLHKHIRAEVARHKANGVTPKVVTLLVEGDPASLYYAHIKQRLAEKLGICFELIRFPSRVHSREILQTIRRLNENAAVHGIMLELPLPPYLPTREIIDSISPLKDVDGLTPFNRQANLTGQPGIYPATPQACLRLVAHYGYSVSGKHVALIGCGQTVGMPLLHLLLRENATVTACHAGTADIAHHVKQADFAFVAVGKPNLLTPDMVHPQLVVVDAGINEIEGGRIVGDVAPEVAGCVAALSPTPGGVGPVTTAQLFLNLLRAIELQQVDKERETVPAARL